LGVGSGQIRAAGGGVNVAVVVAVAVSVGGVGEGVKVGVVVAMAVGVAGGRGEAAAVAVAVNDARAVGLNEAVGSARARVGGAVGEILVRSSRPLSACHKSQARGMRRARKSPASRGRNRRI
jgi:hypothetical protein